MEELSVHKCGGDYVYCNGLCEGCEKNKVRASDVTFKMQLNSPITDEQWNAITDAELEHKDHIKAFTSGMEGYNIARRHMMELIEVLPAADVVEVVRCKDCKYIAHFTDGHIECRLLADLRPVPCTYLTMKEDDYCSYGERRDADAEK